jgi:hypothetical protein
MYVAGALLLHFIIADIRRTVRVLFPTLLLLEEMGGPCE